MGFVNEYASRDDIDKYELGSVLKRYGAYAAGTDFLKKKLYWAIDRERNAYFIPIPLISREPDEAAIERKLLWWNKARIIFEIRLLPGSSYGFGDGKSFIQIWELISLNIPDGFPVERDRVIDVIKEAKVAYGYMGAFKQIPNTITKFNF